MKNKTIRPCNRKEGGTWETSMRETSKIIEIELIEPMKKGYRLTFYILKLRKEFMSAKGVDDIAKFMRKGDVTMMLGDIPLSLLTYSWSFSSEFKFILEEAEIKYDVSEEFFLKEVQNHLGSGR